MASLDALARGTGVEVGVGVTVGVGVDVGVGVLVAVALGVAVLVLVGVFVGDEPPMTPHPVSDAVASSEKIAKAMRRLLGRGTGQYIWRLELRLDSAIRNCIARHRYRAECGGAFA
jgi:hypothetical protein